MKKNKIEKLEELGQQHQARQFYRDINKLRKDFKYTEVRMEALLLKKMIF